MTPPQLTHKVEPKYTEAARAAGLEGKVVLEIEIWPDGKAHKIRVLRGLDLGVDQKAVEAVEQWRFLPGRKDGRPVKVRAKIEVNFQLLDRKELISAVRKRLPRQAKGSVDRDANSDSNGSQNKLIQAVHEGRTDRVKVLLDQDADPNAKDHKGIAGLIYAVLAGQLEIVQALVAQGADPNTKARDGVSTALMLAADKGHTKIVQALLASGADVNARGNSGLTALQIAIHRRHTPTVKALLASGADVDQAAWFLAQGTGYAATLQKMKLRPVKGPQKRYEFNGFSVLPPAGKKWTADVGTKRVMFQKNTGTSGRRTVIAFAESKPLGPKVTGLTTEQFLASMESLRLADKFEDERYKLLDHRVFRDSAQRAGCVKFEFTVEDHGVPYAPGEVFILTGEDNYCLHPDSPQPLMVQVSYSQRYPKRKKPLPIQLEVEPFLKSLAFSAIQ